MQKIEVINDFRADFLKDFIVPAEISTQEGKVVEATGSFTEMLRVKKTF